MILSYIQTNRFHLKKRFPRLNREHHCSGPIKMAFDSECALSLPIEFLLFPLMDTSPSIFLKTLYDQVETKNYFTPKNILVPSASFRYILILIQYVHAQCVST